MIGRIRGCLSNGPGMLGLVLHGVVVAMKGKFGAMGAGRWLATVAVAGILSSTGAAPAFAQDSNTNARLSKVESEVRALQRKVFPGADGRVFEPQITATQAPQTTPSIPTSTPVSDLLGRMDAVEAQMARLTAQVEQNTNRLSQLEARLASDAVPAPAVVPPVVSSNGMQFAPTSTPQTSATQLGSPPRTTTPVAASNSRIDAVKAVVKPQTADVGDDEYSYGFRLWEAKFYPEAQQQLKLFLEKYPRHARVSWGRNLLGRAYLDNKNPSEAAKWFLQNFQADKRGDRAPDSLLYLALSMKQLKDTKRACIALAEFSETYATEAAGRLSSVYNSTRSGLTCN